MQCSSCKSGTLKPSYLDDLFPCLSCDNCGGNFIMLSDFLRWKDANPEHSSKDKSKQQGNGNIKIEANETSHAMICPRTGGLMTKYRISANTEHRLDLSPTINAVWMDKGEWELLKQEGLTNKLNTIFTSHWQREIVNEETNDTLAALYERRFGDDYQEIKEFRAKLESMNNRSDVIAYLLADDPYSV